MKTLDLGELSGTLLFFGGPYSNLQAAQAVRAVAEQLEVKASNTICTGDTVAYCARPNETVGLLREWGVSVVMGNCEESLGTNAGDCGCGFEEGSACNALAQNWYRFVDQKLEIRHRQWMKSLPKLIKFNYLQKQFAVIHGGVKQINRFIFSSTNHEDKLQELNSINVVGIVAGHSGIPFTQVVDGRIWHNPGVIGMPGNDGTARVWYSLWSDVHGKIKIEHRSLGYNYSEARADMLHEGLGDSYAQTLVTGLWPSLDVLPLEEKTRQGKALNENVYWL